MKCFSAWQWIVLTGLITLTLSACGGGDANVAPSLSPPQNMPPIFSTDQTVEIEENTSGTVLQIAVSDPDGDALTLAIDGDDADIFVLDQSVPEIQLETPLDFEAPSDANADNLYEITLTATDDQGAGASLAVTIMVTDLAEALTFSVVASSLSNPLQAVTIPNSDNLLIVEQAGTIRVLSPQSGVVGTLPFLDISAEVSGANEQGLLGLAFSPDFANDNMVFANLTNLDGDTEIRSYQTFSSDAQQADITTENLILTISQPFANHNAGWIGFDNNGDMLIPTGDGGGAGDPLDNAQDPNSLLGKVLRIDVAGDDFPSDETRDYAIPPSNPFANGGGAPEIYALGLRNPFRASLDGQTGALLIGDVGQDEIEEVDRIPNGVAGINFGWNLREGTQVFNDGADTPAFTPPLLEYEHGFGPFQGNSIIGGVIYRGPLTSLDGHYVFADTITGNIWAVPEEILIDGLTLDTSVFLRLNDLLPADFNPGNITSLAMGVSGDLLLTNLQGDLISITETP